MKGAATITGMMVSSGALIIKYIAGIAQTVPTVRINPATKMTKSADG